MVASCATINFGSGPDHAAALPEQENPQPLLLGQRRPRPLHRDLQEHEVSEEQLADDTGPAIHVQLHFADLFVNFVHELNDNYYQTNQQPCAIIKRQTYSR